MKNRTGEQPRDFSSKDSSATQKLDALHKDEASSKQNSGSEVVPTAPPEDSQDDATLRTPNFRQFTPDTIRQTRPTFWSLVQHVVALVLLGLMLLLAIIFYIQTPVGQELDELSFNEFSYQFIGLQSQTSQVLDFIPVLAGIIAVVGMIFALVWKHRFIPALVGLGVALGANVSTQVLKNYLITKPNFGLQEASLNSAPSGHTTFAAAAAAALFLASPKKLRPFVAMLGAIISFSAGFSTIVNGWHRPADVITAILLTSLWTVIGLIVLRFLRSEELDLSDTQRTGLILIPLLSISGFFLGFCSLALYLVTFYDPISGGALIAATSMMLSVIAFTTSLHIGLLRARNKRRSAYTKIWTY